MVFALCLNTPGSRTQFACFPAWSCDAPNVVRHSSFAWPSHLTCKWSGNITRRYDNWRWPSSGRIVSGTETQCCTTHVSVKPVKVSCCARSPSIKSTLTDMLNDQPQQIDLFAEATWNGWGHHDHYLALTPCHMISNCILSQQIPSLLHIARSCSHQSLLCLPRLTTIPVQ